MLGNGGGVFARLRVGKDRSWITSEEKTKGAKAN